MKTAFFDIESGPDTPERLEAVKPIFDAGGVLKDPEKIKAKLAEKESDWLQRAALDATTGQILAIGIQDDSGFHVWEGTESGLMTRFWEWLDQQLASGVFVIGFCSFRFDLPMCIRRSLLHGVRVPISVRRGRYWNENLLDIAEIWSCGNRDQTISLDTLSKYLGVGAKNGKGEDFAKLWETDKAAAFAYLENDLKLTKAVWDKIQVCVYS